MRALLITALGATLLGGTLVHASAHATDASAPAPRKSPPGGVYARHAVAIDPVSGETLFQKDPARTVPIASITKLMTAMVVREREPDLDEVVEVTREHRRGAGRSRVRIGERVRLGDLLHLSLMVSDNCATRTLASNVGLSSDDFVMRMNERARELGLEHTHFVEVTGLRGENVSTALEVATLLRAAAEDSLLRTIMAKRSFTFTSESARAHEFPNTNRMVYDRFEVLAGKTGHIGDAGYCVVTWLRDGEHDLIAVVLGAPNSKTRFNDVRRIMSRVERARKRAAATPPPQTAPRGDSD